MKARSHLRFSASRMAGACLLVLYHGGGLAAAPLYWNPAGPGEIWGTGPAEKNWNAVPAAVTGNIAWPDTIDDVAVFQDPTGGVVTLSDPLQTAGIIQNGANYSINAGVITLVADSGAANPFINVQGGTLTIDSVLAGSNGLIKNGSGSLVLTGSNTYSGNTLIAVGTLDLAGSLASASLSISSGATLLNQNGGLSNSATLSNAGSLTLNANDTITSYISNGGTLTAGAGTLFTTSAALNTGSTVAGLLNTGSITSNGAVAFSGSASVMNTATVQSGTLTLTGTLATPVLNITAGATMIQNGTMGPGSPALATTVVTNEGSFVIQKSAVLKTYISNGGLLDIQNDRLITQNVFLNDGSVTKGGPFSADLLTTTGAVRIENSALGGQAIVASGVLDLVGSIGANDVQIASGASLLNQNGGLRNTATVTNAGSLVLFNSDQINTYTSNGGLLDVRNGTLTTTRMNLNDGSITRGSAATNQLVSQGAVRIEGSIIGDAANIASGVLTLTGTLGLTNTSIATSATLLNDGGGFTHTIFLTNAGTLDLRTDAMVRDYISNGGLLVNSPGTLFSTSATLNNGSSIAGLLNTGTLTSNGAVQVTGIISANSINIATGTLTNTGTLGNASTLLDINQGATLAAGGIQLYSLLTTSGAGPGTWLGDLDNSTTIAPGGLGTTGILAVDGNFTQSPAGTLKFDLSATGSDLLDVSGGAVFGGSLELNQAGAPIAPFVPVTVVSASGYAGNISSLSENLDGAVFFNPGNGTVIRLELPSGGSFFGSTRNQTSTWISLYDDVIDPGVANITSGPGGYDITSGIADAGNPDLLWALAASFTPAGLNAALLNRLSPEVYGGFSDYAMQATRAHQRSALSAPALDPRGESTGGMASSAKGGAKGGVAGTAAPLDWEFFAAVDYFRAGTGNSLNQADYDFDGTGVLTGARTRPWDRTQIAVYLGADSGTIEGELIDADAFGWTTGLIGEHLLDAKTRTRLTAGISYGSYAFDGTRGSASATSAGWIPGKVDFDDADVDAFDLFVGVVGVAWKQDALTLIPSAGLRYAMTTMDPFNESTGGAPGSPIALDVSRDRYESLLLELGLLAQVEVNSKLALWGEGGVNVGLLDDGRVLAASFAKGSRGMRAEADGLDDDSFYLGCGAVYRITGDISAAIGYRADIRSGAEAQQELRLSSSWRF